MISCEEVIRELWDYLDGELPVERAALIADHLARCARCHPQYRFEYAFLAAVARQRARGPGPPPALVEQVARMVLADRFNPEPRPESLATEPSGPAAGAALPFSPGRPLGREGARAEGLALLVLRASLGLSLLLGGLSKGLASAGAAALSSALANGVGVIAVILGLCVMLGAWRRWCYPTALVAYLGSVPLWWHQTESPKAVAWALLPSWGGLVTLFLLRQRDPWTLDAWLARRRLQRLVH